MIALDERPVGTGAQEAAFAAFRYAYPAFETTGALDDLRATEYARLNAQGQGSIDGTSIGGR